MNRDVWARVEQLLLKWDIRPLIAVVPDNQDEFLRVDRPDPRFWDRVRDWQERGWTVAMHGYQHVYETDRAGLLGLNDRSEFAGLPISKQEEKLQRGLAAFAREGITPSVWVAPSHSFDQATLIALRNVGLRVISDGFSLFPHTDTSGTVWIPQQLWRFYNMPAGVWTVCCHSNGWSPENVVRLEARIHRYRDRISDVDSVLRRYHDRVADRWDGLAAASLPTLVRVKRSARTVPSRLFRRPTRSDQRVPDQPTGSS
jgi:Uncharacterized protein conserved in bacteria (DUF2334)